MGISQVGARTVLLFLWHCSGLRNQWWHNWVGGWLGQNLSAVGGEKSEQSPCAVSKWSFHVSSVLTWSCFWIILEFVSKCFLTPSENNGTKKACHVLSHICILPVFVTCRKLLPFRVGEPGALLPYTAAPIPFKTPMFSLGFVLPGHGLCSFTSAKQFAQCSSSDVQLVLLLGNTSWRVIKLWKLSL